jgi:hypothetical protein
MKTQILAGLIALSIVAAMPQTVRAEDNIEKAGVAVGVTAGNMWFLPIKAIAMSVGAISGALSYVVTGGNSELTQQIWRDTQQKPYVITPELARTAVGRRPELEEKKSDSPAPQTPRSTAVSSIRHHRYFLLGIWSPGFRSSAGLTCNPLIAHVEPIDALLRHCTNTGRKNSGMRLQFDEAACRYSQQNLSKLGQIRFEETGRSRPSLFRRFRI